MKKMFGYLVGMFVLGFVAVPSAYAAMVADVSLPARSSDRAYHILYRNVNAEGWESSVRDVANNIKSYRISGLKSGVKYEYTIVSVNKSGTTSVAPKRAMSVYNYEKDSNMEKGKTYRPVGVSSVRIEWSFRSNAQKYNVYYRERSAETWTHSVANLSQTTDRITIKSLVPSRAYVYKVMGVDKKGKEFSVIAQRELRPKK